MDLTDEPDHQAVKIAASSNNNRSLKSLQADHHPAVNKKHTSRA
jgi:hypothetical protein